MAVGLSSSVWSDRMSIFRRTQASLDGVHELVLDPLNVAVETVARLASQTSAPGCLKAVSTLQKAINEVNAAIKAHETTPKNPFSENTNTRCHN